MQIERKKISSQVLDKLMEMIKSSELPANSQMPTENELSKLFGVSRSPIREALSVLEASGIIETRQGGRSWINEVSLANLMEQVQLEIVSREQVLDLLEMRTIIESEVAALAAERHTEEDIKEIFTILENFREVMVSGAGIGYELDYAFHNAIVKSAYNPFLTETMHNLSDLHLKALKFSLEKNLGWGTKRKEVYLEHLQIYEAIKSRDSELARQAAKTHLTNVRKKLGDTRIK